MKLTEIKVKSEKKDKDWKNPFPEDETYKKRDKDQDWSIEFYNDEEFDIDLFKITQSGDGSMLLEITGSEESIKKLGELLEDNSTCQVLIGKEGFCGDGWILYLRPDPFHKIREVFVGT